MLDPKELNVLAEIVGFLATIMLTYQTVRLLKHQRSVRNMRQTADDLKKLRDQADAPNKATHQKAIELAEQGAKILENTIAQWDKRDQYFVFVGLGGLMLSFALKLLGFWLEP